MSRRHTPLAADIKAIHVAEDATPAAPGELPLLLTIIETARATGMGLTHTRKLISSGVLPSVRLSPRIIRVPRDALLAFIAAGGPAGGVQGAKAAQAEPLQLHERIG